VKVPPTGPTRDTESPTAPGGVTATARSDAQITVVWQGSHDNVGVTALVDHWLSTQQSYPPSDTPPTVSGQPIDPLACRLEVDEAEWSLVASHNPVAAGNVQFNISNYGQDQHDMAIVDANGNIIAQTGLIDPQRTAALTADLPPGTYTLECTLFGHHEHYNLCMHATLTVQYDRSLAEKRDT
jgi:hypothetical protein